MAISLFDLFKIGIGPSSSHTIGPMRAALRFAEAIESTCGLVRLARIHVTLHGSLAFTGKGHATDTALVLGLCGEAPDRVRPELIAPLLERVRATGELVVLGKHAVAFDPDRDIVFDRTRPLPHHSNGMRFEALAANDAPLLAEEFYSTGGGFILSGEEIRNGASASSRANVAFSYPYRSAAELLAIGTATGLSIADIALANERAWRDDAEIRAGILHIWSVMRACIERGCRTDGILPGGLGVRRRAPAMHRALSALPTSKRDPLSAIDRVSLYALAVNEENAAGGQVVTAPTNGAAGVIPAVLHHYEASAADADADGIVRFLLTAAAIGALYKENASISAAEVGCQGEIGVACSMAAAGLAAVMGGTNAQIENAAEIGMEHNLGLTCDPVGGLVQIPCIERNTMGAVKAINAARLALNGDGRHSVSLDQVIATMRRTGADMHANYKETSLGGLAVSVVEC